MIYGREQCIMGYSTCSVPFWTGSNTAVTKKITRTLFNSEVYSSHFIKNFDSSKGLINSLWLAETLIAYRKDFLLNKPHQSTEMATDCIFVGCAIFVTLYFSFKAKGYMNATSENFNFINVCGNTNPLNAQNAVRFCLISDMWRVYGTERTSGSRFIIWKAVSSCTGILHSTLINSLLQIIEFQYQKRVSDEIFLSMRWQYNRASHHVAIYEPTNALSHTYTNTLKNIVKWTNK